MNRSAPKQQRDASGKRLCRWPNCGKPVAKGRRSCCSDKCCYNFSVCFFPSFARAEVFKRDKGVCAKCRVDTERLRRILRKCKKSERQLNVCYSADWAAAELGFNDWYSSGGFWQADHNVPVATGGQLLGLSNLRTLCTPCHKEETALLAYFRKMQARSAKGDAAAAEVIRRLTSVEATNGTGKHIG